MTRLITRGKKTKTKNNAQINDLPNVFLMFFLTLSSSPSSRTRFIYSSNPYIQEDKLDFNCFKLICFRRITSDKFPACTGIIGPKQTCCQESIEANYKMRMYLLIFKLHTTINKLVMANLINRDGKSIP